MHVQPQPASPLPTRSIAAVSRCQQAFPCAALLLHAGDRPALVSQASRLPPHNQPHKPGLALAMLQVTGLSWSLDGESLATTLSATSLSILTQTWPHTCDSCR